MLRLSLSIAVINAIILAAGMLYISRPEDVWWWWPLTLFFWLLTSGPQYWLYRIVKKREAHRRFWIGLQLFLLIACSYIYADALFIHPDPQGGLVMLFLPIYQYILIGLLLGGYTLFTQWRAKRQ